jgi:hypothetical protein
MAGKKPAKVNSSNKKEKVELPGKAVKYMGSKDSQAFSCPTCKRELIKGIIYEHKSSAYCTRGCIPKEQEMVAG